MMRKATRKVAALFGVAAGLAGLEHGYFEILQGSTPPEGVMIPSMGPPCVPEEIWNACEPAMTIIPNFLITGILAAMIGVFILFWSAAFVQRKHGGLVLLLLSVALLLFGGGLFPPLIGIVAGFAGMTIHKPLASNHTSRFLQFLAKLWPWPLVIMLVWLLGQFVVGYFFNDFLLSVMGYAAILILIALLLSVFSAYAFDRQISWQGE